ncbi:MAG: hypothetical protein AABX82_05000 [Nanoarchaeota archaeon]
MVSYHIRNKIKYFQATDPGRIVDFIEDKKRDLGEHEAEIKNIR